MKPFSKHLPFATLVDIAAGQAEDNIAADARNHLAACSDCRTMFSSAQRLLSVMDRDELVPPPERVLARALQVFHPTQESARGLMQGLRSLVALLSFDSGLSPAMGMRSGTTQVRQLLFTVDEFDIDVRLQPDNGAWRLEGQVLGGASGGMAALAGSEHEYTGEVNSLGEFVFTSVQPDVYRMHITLPDAEIAIPELPLAL
jgi:hypothetical protein